MIFKSIPTHLEETLSIDAKIVMGSVFRFAVTELNFAMQESKPTARMQAALDELVAAKAISKTAFGLKGVKYKTLVDTRPFMKYGTHEAGKDLVIAEPIG